MTEKCGFLKVRPPDKSWSSESQSESKGPHCYGPCSRVPAGLPRGEVTERSEDQGEGKGPHRYGPCSPSPVYASPWAKCIELYFSHGIEDVTGPSSFVFKGSI